MTQPTTLSTADDEVAVKGWNDRSAVAIVNGTRVRVRRLRHTIRWICDAHGTDDRPHCVHLDALAAAPADPNRKTRNVR